MDEHENKVWLLEYQLFNLACVISASAALAITLLDIFVTAHIPSVYIDVSAFIIFSIFYYLSKNESIYPRLIYPFIIILYILINISWFLIGGGFNYSDAIIFFLIFITSLLIIPKKNRSRLIIFTAINVLALIVAENMNNELRFKYTDRSMEIFISDIFLVLLFSIGGYLILNFKVKYEFLSQQLIRAYEKIKESNKDLELLVQQRTGELKKANKELDRLFYRSSHDFRRPLTTLMGINEVARLMKLNKNSMELFYLMNRTVENMDNMLRKFYNLYEISHYSEEALPVSLSAIVERYESELLKKGHIIKTVVNLKKYEDVEMRNRLIDIILNCLIENALAFTNEKHAEISLKITEKGNDLNLVLEDKGIGIDDVYFERIFDMYFRSSEKSQGNGLGLYVVKIALDKLHGSVTVSSEKGRYSHFEINIPI